MSATPRLKLPFISPGQAQKELFHNEALQVVDSAVAAAVETLPQNDPPASASLGLSFIVGPVPTGAWAGKAGQIATMSSGGWRYLAPVEGLSALVKSNGLRAAYRAGSWEIGVVRAERVEIGGDPVLSTRSSAIASPAGGSVVDSASRTAIDEILAVLRHHGLIGT